MRYPDLGEAMAFEQDGKRHLGNYVRENCRWRRANWNDLGPRLAWVLDREYAEMLKPHPLLAWARSRAR